MKVSGSSIVASNGLVSYLYCVCSHIHVVVLERNGSSVNVFNNDAMNESFKQFLINNLGTMNVQYDI